MSRSGYRALETAVQCVEAQAAGLAVEIFSREFKWETARIWPLKTWASYLSEWGHSVRCRISTEDA